jgi:hypothetical protein
MIYIEVFLIANMMLWRILQEKLGRNIKVAGFREKFEIKMRLDTIRFNLIRAKM